MTIAIIATGGTIASTTRPDRAVALPELTADELLSQAGLTDKAVVRIDFAHEMSSALTQQQVMDLARLVDSQASAGVSAFVVTQGTATLAETSYMLDLLLGDVAPVACTGAMRPASDLSPDGPVNLRDAATFAMGSQGVRTGVYVVANGEVHAPIDVIKVNAASPAGFVSPGVGVLGWVDAGQIRMRRDRRRREHRYAGLAGPVEVVTAYLDATTTQLESVVAAGSPGMIIVGFPGRGTVPPSWIGPIERYLAAGGHALFVSPSLLGRVLPKHGGIGSCRQLDEMGVIMGGDLQPAKARCLLLAILSETQDREDIASRVAEELATQ